MALKDITLGQFFPGSTILHRLDPRTKLLMVILYIVALFMAKNAFGYGLLLLSLVAAILLSKVGFKAVFRGMKPVLFIVILTALLNLLYTGGEGDPLVSFWIIHIYWEGVRTALFMVLRILMLITCTFLLTYTTSPILLTDALENLLGPLKKLHLPIHELAMMMSIALRFIPTLIEETDKIMSAQKARGADFESGNLIQKAKALIPLLVPLFVSAFRRADELAVAMECRCYHGGEGRTRLKQLKYAGKDYVALAVSLALCAAIWGINRLGIF
jgi:energy-coupling factor transport system permease protein